VKIAVIPPVHHADMMELGDFYFVLAQRLIKDDMWIGYLRDKASPDKIILLDNGAFELEKSISTDELLDLAKRIGADEVVAPDHVMHGAESFEMARDFISVCPRRLDIVAIPHGRTIMEVANYYEQLAKMAKVSVIGLSVVFHKRHHKLRPHLYHYLVKTGKWTTKMYHHLFGLDSLVELWCYNPGDIRSVDTSLPFSMAHIEKKLISMMLPEEHERVPDDAVLTPLQIEYAKKNIRMMKNVASLVG